MKVVLFCGGLGLRMREASPRIPKPMVPVGYRPILWHIMKYYAHFGHKDFILCLGHKAEVIKSLPRLQRGVVERLRPVERREERRAPLERHARVDDHVRRSGLRAKWAPARRAQYLEGEEYFLATTAMR